MSNWKEFPKTKDKVAIVGFHPATRDQAPFDDPDYEIWAVNEEYVFPWMKRWNRTFQLHPRWDFSRSNNGNDPNHFLWIKNEIGPCIRCNGTGKAGAKGELDCPDCEQGMYYPEKHKRQPGCPIYMQKQHADIEGSIKIPYSEIWEKFDPQSSKPYFTSSAAFQLGMAMLLDFQVIEFYGYDMGTLTEYHYQRAGFEYWVGMARGYGFEVNLPNSAIAVGELYGIDNMKTGYRQQLEMREHALALQFNQTKNQCNKLEAKMDLLKELKVEYPDLAERYKTTQLKLAKQQGILNFINGAKTETKNLTGLYSNYFLTGTESGKEDEEGEVQSAYTDNDNFVNARYVDEDGNDG